MMIKIKCPEGGVTRQGKVAVLALVTAAIAAVDALLPDGFSGNVLYIIVIIAVARWRIASPYLAAAVLSVASAMESLVAPSALPPAVELADRMVTIVVLWICAALVTELQRQRASAEEAREIAEHANRRKSRFLAAASHDLRQPAQSLVLLASVLKSRAAATPLQPVIDPLNQAIDALNSLLSSLLEVSRLDAGLVRKHVSRVDMPALLRRLDREYQLTVRSRGLRLKVVCRPDLQIHTDPALLERILRNLLDNAVKYTRRGGILLYGRRWRDGVRFDVVDTGIGIHQSNLDAIFEEFLQLDNEARDRTRGLGLGLSVVQRLVQLLGGDVKVRSRVGVGSRFSVRLPDAAAEAEDAVATDVHWPEATRHPAA